MLLCSINVIISLLNMPFENWAMVYGDSVTHTIAC